MKALLRTSLVCLLSGSLLAQSTDTTTASTAKKPKSTTHRMAHKPAGPTLEQQLKEMRDMLQTQQQQIQQLQSQLSARDRQVQQAQTAAQHAAEQANSAAQKADAAQTTGSDAKTQVVALDSKVSDIKINDQNLTETIQTEQKRVGEIENPSTIHFKGITISPTGSFIEAASVWRQKGEGADINTDFKGIPWNGAPNANLSELNFSGRQSRLALLGEGKIGNYTARAYYEADWLSAGTTSNNNQSNSYTMRQRQLFGQIQSAGGWTFTGGQMWSLATETRTGLDNRTEVLPQTIDPQYHAGFTWARQPGFRITRAFGMKHKFWLGAAVEEAQFALGGGGFNGAITFSQAGDTAGLYNNGGNTAQQNYVYNKTPDFIFKAAAEPGWGHYEVFGIVRTFRDRIYPNATAANAGTAASATGAFNYSTTGGGIGFNARMPVVPKKLDFAIHFLGGDGVGRYGDSTLADVTTRIDGTLSPIRGGSALGGLELHATPKLDVYAYYGGDYVERELYNTNGKVGYGRPAQATTGCNVEVISATGNITSASSTTLPANCSPDLRAVQEFSLGWWYDFYRGPKGRIRQSFQYSYFVKNSWAGTGGSPNATDNMWWTAFRYYLP
jgi:hypothetical protein